MEEEKNAEFDDRIASQAHRVKQQLLYVKVFFFTRDKKSHDINKAVKRHAIW